METFYKWRVQEKDKRGRVRWRIVKAPMTESTAHVWAANNHKIIERIDTPVAPQSAARPLAARTPGLAAKARS